MNPDFSVYIIQTTAKIVCNSVWEAGLLEVIHGLAKVIHARVDAVQPELFLIPSAAMQNGQSFNSKAV